MDNFCVWEQTPSEHVEMQSYSHGDFIIERLQCISGNRIVVKVLSDLWIGRYARLGTSETT